MSADVAALTKRVESLLDRFEQRSDADELVRTLLTLYGEGLSRILAILRQSVDGESLIETICEDPFIASLLLIHDLHPVPLQTRVERALEHVRPYLRSHEGDVDLVGIEDGVVELRLRGSCDGCASSSATLKQAVERAIFERAPEVLEIRSNAAAPSIAELPQVIGIRSSASR